MSADDELTEYEKQRLAHVARNREYMARLGVASMAKTIGLDPSQAERAHKKVKRHHHQREPLAPTRRSSRVVGAKPEYTGETIDDMFDGEETENRFSSVAKKNKLNKMMTTPEERDDAYVETSREWLAEARERLLALRAEAANAGPDAKNEKKKKNAVDNAVWREDAVARWGEDVPALSAVADWKSWTKSRLGNPPKPSALQLLQEYYAHDAWQLLIACALMSRVASGPLKHECISNFFEKFPTPTAALKADADEVFEIIKRLGLFPGRMRTIVEVSSKFLTHTGEFEVGLDPEVKIYGIGEFGVDSFEIFARGDVARKPKDANLNAFCAWQRRHAAD